MIHALVLLVSLLVLGPVMAQIPLSALAGVLLVTAGLLVYAAVARNI